MTPHRRLSTAAALAITLAFGSVPFTASAFAEGELAGQYAGSDTALTLKSVDGVTYLGEVTYHGTTFPVEATSKGDELHGTFTHNGQSFQFSVTPASDKSGGYVFKTGNATVPLTFKPTAKKGGNNPFDPSGDEKVEKKGPANPFDKSGKSAEPTDTGGETADMTHAIPAKLLGGWSNGEYVMNFAPSGSVDIYPEATPAQRMTGTYTVTGNAMTITVNGKTQTATFQIDGDAMTTIDANGEVETVHRIKPQTDRKQSPDGPATGLQGAWSGGNFVMSFGPNGVLENWPVGNPQQKTQGTYTVNGNKASFTLGGQKTDFTYQISGNQMTVTWPDGSTQIVTRTGGNEGEIPLSDLREITDEDLKRPIMDDANAKRYQGNIQGTLVDMTLTADGNQITGIVLDPDQYRYDLTLTGSLSKASGTLYDPQTEGSMQIELEATPGGVNIILINEGQRFPMEFKNADTARAGGNPLESQSPTPGQMPNPGGGY